VLSSLSDALLRPTSPQDSVSISSFAKIDIDKCEIDQTATYKTAGVLNSGEGLFSKDDFVGASTKYKQMIRLHANQIVMRKLTAWEGAIAVVPQEFSRAVVSTEFPTLTLDESIAAPAYLKWVFRQPWFWHEMKARSKGTALRRSRLNPKDLITIAVSLPCMERQSEIIGSLEDLESQQGAIQRRRQNLLALKEAILKGVFSEDPENPVGTTEGNTE
jgi:type I restriction enzyme S subunit